jgi:hypothetical protein
MTEHEALKRNRRVVASSDRSFGLVFAAVFFAVAFWPALRHGESVRWWPVLIGLLFSCLAHFKPDALTPLNRLWFKLGSAIHAVMSPVIMWLLFYGAVAPFALVLKALGKDILRLRPSSESTYWISRDPSEPARESMKHQF